MSLKVELKHIVDSCKSKDDVKFYKVQLEETWIHESYLENCKDLVDQYWKTKNKCDEKSSAKFGKDASPANTITTETEYSRCDSSVCRFCEEEISDSSRIVHEKEHLTSKTSVEVIQLLKNTPKDPKEMFTLFCPSEIPMESSNVTGEQSIGDDVDNVLLKRSDVDVSPIYVCPRCSEEFASFGLYRTHYHLYHLMTSSQSSGHCCQTCNKSFTAYSALVKHSKLHQKEQSNFYKIYRKRYFAQQSKERKKKVTSKSTREAPTVKKQSILPTNSIQNNSGENTSGVFPRIKDALATTKHLPGSNEIQSSDSCTRILKEPEFSPEVLKSARQYIKAVSQRRKKYTLKRILSSNYTDVTVPIRPEKHSVTGIGVDVELKKSEESLPIVSKENGRYSYSCKICGKTFFNKFHHREHFNVHSGEMPYECEFCSKRFAQRSGWNRHIKLHHKYEVFQGPIPYSQSEKIRNTLNKKQQQVHLPRRRGVQIASPNVAAIPADTSANRDARSVTRYIPIAPYPAQGVSSIPADPAILSPGRFPGGTMGFIDATGGTINQVLLQPVTMVASTEVRQSENLPESVPKIVSVTSGNRTISSEAFLNSDSETIFQCKNVSTMEGNSIFMVRIAPSAAHKIEQRVGKMDFAFVLDYDGHVKSKIFVKDYTGDDWIDFPLDPLANMVLLHRLKHFGGPKLRAGLPSSSEDDDLVANGSKNLEKAFKEFQQRCDVGSSNHSNKNSMVKILPKMVYSPIIESNRNVEATMEASTLNEQQTHVLVPKETCGRKYTSGKEKRFSCSTCGRKFLAQAHLNDHMLIHTGELPYTCMFCSRPFRHKSGLNSHHKRHIQNGIFDRPLSASKAKKTRTENNQETESTESSNINQTNSTQPSNNHRLVSHNEKSKRKSRTPKHVEPRVSMGTDILLRIKEEVDDEGENIDIGVAEQISFNTRDIFECNFCGMSFPLRTAYLKHVNTVHKAPNIASRHFPLDDTSSSAPSTGTNLDSEYIGIDDFSNVLLDCDDSVESSPHNVDVCLEERNQDPDHVMNDDILLNVKIKQEVIDE